MSNRGKSTGPSIGFRISSETYAETATVQIRDLQTDEVYRTPEGEPVTITVYGQDSKQYRRIQHAHQNRNIQKAQRTRRATLTAEQLEANRLDLVIGCVADWYGFGDENGDPLECNEQNVRMLFEHYPDIRDQVEEEIHDRANFTKSSSRS